MKSSISLRPTPGDAEELMESEHVVIVASYMAVSSLLLVVNKLSIGLLPNSGIVLTLQVMVTTAISAGFSLQGPNTLSVRHLLRFFVPAIAFLSCLVANIEVLRDSNVEIIIVFRSTTPLLISLCEWLCLGRQLPSLRSWAALSALFVFSGMYAWTDAEPSVGVYSSVAAWYFIFCFNQLYVKFVTDDVPVKSNWEAVFYMNVWAMLFLISYEIIFDFHTIMHSRKYFNHVETVGCVALSCAMAVLMSYLTMACRKAVSATAFTVVGNVCKVITIVVSALIWGQHVTLFGTASLLACLVAATFYEQAPLRSERNSRVGLLPKP